MSTSCGLMGLKPETLDGWWRRTIRLPVQMEDGRACHCQGVVMPEVKLVVGVPFDQDILEFSSLSGRRDF